MRLNHNLSSLNIYREYSKTLKANSKALSHISTGEKVVKASEGPNTIAKSERMRLQIRGMQMSQRNVQDGISMMQTADGSLSSLSSILNRVRELVVQAGSGSNNDEDKEQIKGEINQMLDGYNQIVKDTEFNGVKLLSVEDEKTMQSGANSGESINITFKDLSLDKVGVLNPDNSVDSDKSLKKLREELDLSKPEDISKALEIVDAASNSIIDLRSKYGALSNKFESTFDNLGEFEASTQKCESRIRDADIAEEMIQFTRTGVLIEAGNAMMVQSNKFPQDVLRILENVRSR
ncbi:flagellin [Clostridium lundense]|uniref:flagellin N-terminal helical domain-containing protein n=1 Tax=Clostridium lundense TaxID=319475 RepID=UPI00048093B8|nr:flagellin [Clostridium lundense]